ncbi:unnamed protein product [Periconia digitata]|uniref:Uncharacterized protein n=1 Tax=Periconia digitata TaxID=1303443 RepID=A0A9W4UWA7_9PLEO|nr:unnamed protein product [Periconia digitata]
MPDETATHSNYPSLFLLLHALYLSHPESCLASLLCNGFLHFIALDLSVSPPEFTLNPVRAKVKHQIRRVPITLYTSDVPSCTRYPPRGDMSTTPVFPTEGLEAVRQDKHTLHRIMPLSSFHRACLLDGHMQLNRRRVWSHHPG